MWTWTYEAHEFTHDDEGDQVMALFSFSLSPEREEQKKKRNSFWCFSVSGCQSETEKSRFSTFELIFL